MSKAPLGPQRLAATLAWLFALALLANTAAHGARYQWDFKVYYYAARTFAAGGDPYAPSPQNFTPAGYLPFLYPPLTLTLFRLFALPPILPAAALWLGLKLIALAALLTVWSRRFLPLRALSAPTVLFFLLAFNRTLYTDIITGNVTVFEDLALWLGFAALLSGRPWAFCACLILAAQFKIIPIAFLVLLLLVPPRPQWGAFFTGLLGFAALFSLNALLYPGLTRQFFANSLAVDHRGSNNPSTLAFFRDFADKLALPLAASPALYLLTAAAVLAASALAYVSYRHRAATPSPRPVIFFACLVYGLCAPRFANYTYILLLVPALFVLRAEPRKPVASLVAVIVLLSGAMASLAGTPYLRVMAAPYSHLPSLLRDYLPLWSAFLLWFLLLRRLRASESGKMTA